MQSNSGGVQTLGSSRTGIASGPFLVARCAHLFGTQLKTGHSRPRALIACSGSSLDRQYHARAERQWQSSAGRKPFLTGYGQMHHSQSISVICSPFKVTCMSGWHRCED